jgi:hypothetical protein
VTLSEERFIEVAKLAFKSGVTVTQLAIMHSITEQEVFSILHNRGYSVSALKNESQSPKDTDNRKVIRRKSYLKRIKAAQRAEYRKQEINDKSVMRELKKKLEGITDKYERWETAYGAAMLTFERRQARDAKRPALPALTPKPASTT